MNRSSGNTQKIRFALFYLSAFIFLAGAPFILSYALGYKFNLRAFRFIKTGLLALKTEPASAEVYINGWLKKEKTPVAFSGLLPGTYSVEIKLSGHYPWSADVRIDSGKVTGYEKIILFPLRPDIKQLNKEEAFSFYLHKENDTLYYFDSGKKLIYKSDLEGNGFSACGRLFPLRPASFQYKVSADRKKILYFNLHQIGVSSLLAFKEGSLEDGPLVFDLPRVNIRNVFWHSSGYYLILVTSRNISALELRPDSLPVALVDLSKNNSHAFYDASSDAVYFQDSQRASDGRVYENIYKLELEKKFFDLR